MTSWHPHYDRALASGDRALEIARYMGGGGLGCSTDAADRLEEFAARFSGLTVAELARAFRIQDEFSEPNMRVWWDELDPADYFELIGQKEAGLQT
ncbi:MAG: hypothetical protein JOZ16_01170 [Methylobacteriaceae bacterium]|nr:hypothetical protein [Methylobacteriaceae bacterium]